MDYQQGDHVHLIGKDASGRPELVSQFDYDEIDRRLGSRDTDDKITFSDASAALALILEWACCQSGKGVKKPIISAGVRIHALLFLINPTHASYQSLTAIANAAGVTRACVSKALISLRDQLGDILPIRPMMQRGNFKKAQAAALAAGCHASDRKRQKRQKRDVSADPSATLPIGNKEARRQQARTAALVRWGRPAQALSEAAR